MEANSLPSEGTRVPRRDASGADDSGAAPERPLERLASFRFTYVAIFVFVLAYVFTVESFDGLLQAHFEGTVREAAAVEPGPGSVAERVHGRVEAAVQGSPWVRYGGVRVRAIVVGADGRTLLYGGREKIAPPEAIEAPAEATGALLPPIVDVEVAVPHGAVLANGILVLYGALLVTILVGYTRRLTRREQEQLEEVSAARDAVRSRAEHIERELDSVRGRLAQVEPEREVYADEIRTLQSERAQLEEKLASVERREAALRMQTSEARDLEEERQSLEALLEEAAQDLAHKDDEIQSLQSQVKRTTRKRSREADALSRRLRTLYKNLEFDAHAIDGLAALGDEGMRLKAEEAIKRLAEDSEQAGVRRKVGGLPPHLSIFEIGFAGKGRIYYTKGRQRSFRVLAVGAKNSQKADLEYLSRLPKE